MMNQEQINKLCDILNVHWRRIIENNIHKSDVDKITQIKTLLTIDESASNEVISSKFSSYFETLWKLYNLMQNNNLLSDEYPGHLQKINQIIETLHYTKQTMLCMNNVKSTIEHGTTTNDVDLTKFEILEYDKMKPVQQVLFFILEKFREKGYRRYNRDCYKCITTEDNHITHAWTRVDTIENVIYKLTSRSENLPMFMIVTRQCGQMIKSLTDYLEKCNEGQFPTLEKDRHVFSFKNGIYIAKYWDTTNEYWTDKFITYGTQHISPDITACKYFDLYFDDTVDNPDNINTPFLDKIYNHQRLSTEVKKWNKLLLGRLLYDVGELDNWQIIPFLLGQGGTGKSTINNDVAKQFYDDSDVAIISNNIQKKFGLADIYDKLLYIAPEIKYDWCMEQAEFQEMVSGGTLNINMKFKDSKVVTWKTPGILGGNEIPNFVDNSGSIKRRIVVTRFDEKVVHGDTMLGQKLYSEIPNIIRQCNLYYLQTVREIGQANIWEFLPRYFLTNQSQMSESTNSLIHFLCSGVFEFHRDYYCPSKKFIAEYNTHCSENNLAKNRFVMDFYTGPFSQYDIKVERNERRLYPRLNDYNRYCTGSFLVGVDFKYEGANNTNTIDTFFN